MRSLKYNIGTIFIVLLCFCCIELSAQVNRNGVKIGNNASVIQPSAILEMETTNKGILLPRIQDTALINVLNPPDGMMIYVISSSNQQDLYIRKSNVWQTVQNSSNITSSVTNILNNQFAKKSIKSPDQTVLINGGDTAVFRDVILLVNKSKVVTDSTVSKVILSSLVLDSLAQAVGTPPFSDSLVTLIKRQLFQSAHSISSDDELIKITGGNGATLSDVSISIDNSKLAHRLNTSPVKDTLLSIINNQNTGKVNYSDSNTLYVTPNTLKDTAASIRSALSSLKNGVDTIYSSSDTIYWSKNGNKYFALVDTFKTNITAHLQSGYTFGKYTNGQTIQAQGKSASQVIIDALTQSIPPVYLAPTVTITASPINKVYEFGSNLGTITLSSNFIQNDAGSLSGTTYYVNGSSIGNANTFSIASLTTQQTAYVSKAYNQGPCKNNNLNIQDCTGSIAAGNINSATISWTPGYRRYYGWINDTTGITTGLQNSAILALVEASQFSTSQIFGSAASPINTGNPSGTQFFVFGYLSTSPAITAITQNGIPSINAYNSTTLSNFSNSQNATVSIRIYYSKNGQTSSSIIFTN